MKKSIYLIADPSLDTSLLLQKIEKALRGGLFAVQLWDHWRGILDPLAVIKQVHELTRAAHVPLFVNEGLEFLKWTCFDGIHLDKPNEMLPALKKQRPDLLWGMTCSNHVEELQWAERHSLDYISYCSVFPSKTSTSCELVTSETIQNTRQFYQGKVFLAGGINELTLPRLHSLPFDGIALVSAIMGASNPNEAVLSYHSLLNQPTHDKAFSL